MYLGEKRPLNPIYIVQDDHFLWATATLESFASRKSIIVAIKARLEALAVHTTSYYNRA